MEPRGETRGANQPRGILNESVVVDDPKQLCFNVCGPIEGIHQQTTRTRVERQRHGVDGEIASSKIFDDGRRSDDRWFPSLLVSLCARHADLSANIARQRQMQCLYVVVGESNYAAGSLEIFLQLKWIALYGEIKVTDGESADNVTYRTARQVDIHSCRPGDVLYQRNCALLIRRQPDFHRVNVISHALSCLPRPKGRRMGI